MLRVREITEQFVKFGIVGLSNTLISLIIYYCFIAVDPDFYIVGSIVGFFVSVLNSFFWNNRYVFRDPERNQIRALGKTYLSYGFTAIVSVFLLIFLVEIANISEVLAPIINLAITIPLNFVLNKYWAFR